jgi:hypothetical protein
MASAFKIERGIPAPANGAGRPNLYPWHDMEVGDSFVIPIAKRTSVASCQGRFAPKRFITRKISATEARVWRVA